MDWIRTHVKPGMLAVDVGANAGDVTHQFLRAGARVLAIEPHADMAARMRALAPSVTVIEAAATDHDGTVSYHYSRDSVHGSLWHANILDDIGRVLVAILDRSRLPLRPVRANVVYDALDRDP